MKQLIVFLLFSGTALAQSWTVTITESRRDDLSYRAVAVYSKGGVSTPPAVYLIDGSSDIAATLNARIKDQLNRLAAIDAAVVAITTGAYAIKPDPTPPPLSKADQDRLTFVNSVNAFMQAQAGVQIGVTTPLACNAALATMKGLFQAAFADLLPVVLTAGTPCIAK